MGVAVVEDIPLILYTDQSSVVISYRHQPVFRFSSLIADIPIADDDSAEQKASHGISAYRITEFMCVDRGIDQIVELSDFSNGGRFKILVSFE